MACQEKQRLLRDYDTATTRFVQAVGEYRFVLGTPGREQYELLTAVVEEARTACELARRRLEAHDREHRCAAGTASGADRRQPAASLGIAAAGEEPERKS